MEPLVEDVASDASQYSHIPKMNENVYTDAIDVETEYVDQELDRTPAAQIRTPPASEKGYETYDDYIIGRGKADLQWNEKFQILIDSMPVSFVAKKEEFREIQSFCYDLLRLSKDFVHLASLYGKIVISEKELPAEAKTIKPISIGGVAGGAKYLKRGILFKFPQLADQHIYSGMDEWATKSAGHELKGLTGIRNSGVSGLHLPLMALIDYRGYRLVAMSVLPINNKTIVYGSSDGCNRVINTDEDANKLMEQVGEKLNLKPHVAGIIQKNLIHGPADIEVHKGLDGRHYVVDFARIFPPECPEGSREHLYNLLRAEFIQKYPEALSSDAFSRIGGNGPEAAQNNNDIRQATKYLQTDLIKEFVDDFEDFLDSRKHMKTDPDKIQSGNNSSYYFHIIKKLQTSFSKFRKAQKTLVEEMHRYGINVRHLGRVRARAKVPELRRAILVEMLSRVIKANLRTRWRQLMEKHPGAEEESYKHTTAKYLNLVLGQSDKSALYWQFELQPHIVTKYKEALTSYEQTIESTSHMRQDVDFLRSIFHRVCSLCGLKISPPILKKMNADRKWFLQKEPLPELHLLYIRPVIKTTNTIPYIEGLLLLHGLSSEADPEWTLKSSAKKFKEALRVVPGGQAELFALAHVLYQRAQLVSTLDKAIRHLDMAQHWLDFLLESWPEDWSALLLYANVVHMIGDMKNDRATLTRAVALYEKYIDKEGEKDAEAHMQYARCLASLYLFDGKTEATREKATSIAKLAVDLAPNDVDSWGTYAQLLSGHAYHDTSLFAICDDAFARAYSHMGDHNDADTLYNWGKLILRKAAYQSENLDLILLAAMKIKTAVETELKLGQYKVIRDTVDALETITKAPGSLAPAATARTQSWCKVLKTALDKLNQKASLKADEHVIDWDDIDIEVALNPIVFSFVFRVNWWRSSRRPGEPGILRDSAPGKGQNVPAVIKMLRKNLASEQDSLRFHNELKVFQMIDKHPNVVRFYGICDNNIYEMIVLEHCNYGNILSYIARKEFSWEIALSIAHKLAIALEHIHAKNIVVRSLNVYNILVDSEGEPKLSNFLNADFLSDEGSDQAFAEFRSDIMGFGFLMIELGMQRMLHEQERATIKQKLDLPDSWPDQYKDVIRACVKPRENEFRYSMEDIAQLIVS